MACCNPFFMRLDKRRCLTSAVHQQPYLGYQIPCGYCLNCRVDKRNMWSDRAKYELCTKLSASFVTLTYDDVHLMDKLVLDPSSPQSVMLPTLDYKDIRRFINRLRMKIRRLPREQHHVLCNPDFSYIYVGEYGENGSVFDRPHFHILFFGLDFAVCRKLISDEWYGGIVDVLPVLDGAINYVLKYMDKQLFGDLAKQRYDYHGISRPMRCASVSFGSGLYKSKVNEAMKNNWCYRSGRAMRPFPSYFRKKFTGDDVVRLSKHYNPCLVTSSVRNDMRNIYHLRDLSLSAVNSFRLSKARLRERKLRQLMLNDGVGVLDYVDNFHVGWYAPDSHKIRKLDDSVKRWLFNDYLRQVKLDICDPVPF